LLLPSIGSLSNNMSRITYAIFIIFSVYQGTVNGDCGKPQIHPVLPMAPSRTRIIGGNEAVPNSWPWTVYIQYDFGNGKGAMCGGALINLDGSAQQSDKILTAAHCVMNEEGTEVYNPSQFTVLLGAHNIILEDEPNRVIAQVKSVKPHEKYDANGVINDVAILQLTDPVTFSQYVQPICLPTTSAPSDPSKCYAVGWGRISNDNTKTADILQQALLPVLSDATCTSTWGDTYRADTMICAGHLNGSKSTCEGDSGGPLICKEGDHYTLYGSTSFGNGEKGANGLYQCAAANKPSVFSRTHSFLPWIETTVASL
jgi:secreted trypsin-like serine protease